MGPNLIPAIKTGAFDGAAFGASQAAANAMNFDQAIAAGASLVNPIGDSYGWRTGRLTDPFGHDWEVSRQLTSE